jgi:DNA repair exonuclease SbcCD ATPase subunit
MLLIAGLVLTDYNLTKESGIKEMTVTFTETVQVIIGPNGSGKSSTLRQMSAYPPVRGLFGKEGFKSQIFIKDGVYYKLESEFSKPSSPHLFYEGDNEENLNVGRTTETQKELIASHLGITQIVDDLMMNRYTFPKWTAAKRKEFLMGANPDKIGFIGVQIKQVASQIRARKNQIAHLQSRKIILEQDILDADTIASLVQEQEHINQDLQSYQQELMNIEVGVRTIPQDRPSFSLGDLPGIRQTVKRYHYKLSSLSHVNRDDQKRQNDRETVLSKLAVCAQRLIETDDEILKQSSELTELEVRYRELTFEEDVHSVDATIQRLEAERDKLQIPRPSFELTRDELQTKYQELDTLRDKLQLFGNLTVPLLPMKRRQHRERMLQQSQYRQSSYRQRMNDLNSQYDELSRQHSIKPKDIPESPCAKNACPLYANFMGDYQNTERKRNKVQAALDKGGRKITRLDTYTSALSNYLQDSQPYVDRIQWLIGYAQSNPILHHLLRQMEILSVLSTNPNRIVMQLQDAYDQIDRWLKLKDVMSDLETAYAFKSRQISSESADTIKLVSSIENLKKSLYGLRNVITRVSAQKKRLDRDLADITAFSEIKSMILGIQERHVAALHGLANDHELVRLGRLKSGIDSLRSKHFLRMSEIERTLRAQSSLKERYQEEILSQLVILDKQLQDLQQIEAALIVIPRQNMISFINSVFEQANRLIAMIWTLPLKIELLKYDSTLNYEFNVIADNNSSREISECSDGQTEIITLAINLALRIILNHLDIPLCLDEAGRTFDDKHKQNLIHLLRRLLDDRVISQLFLVNHHAALHEGFSQSETLVIREDNVMLPPVYNRHVTFK